MAFECPMCERTIDGDLDYANHHAATCLGPDSPSASAEPAAKRPCRRTELSKEPSLSGCCPVCALSFSRLDLPTADEQTAHVEACLYAQQAAASPPKRDALSGSDGEEVCPVCGQGWEPFADRDAHVAACLNEKMIDGGFEDEGEDGGSALLAGKDTFDAVKGHKGVMAILDQLLQHSCNIGASRSVSLCVPEVEYINGQITDFGWGCGYRNMQMLLAVAKSMPAYERIFRTDDGGIKLIPSIEELQILIESGWKEGFDPEGRQHFGGKLHKRRKWIGTTEAYVALTLLGIRSTIYDFPKATGPKGQHVALTNWVKRYFAEEANGTDRPKGYRSSFDVLMVGNGTSVRRTSQPPLYLQHDGHSRTIVGLEQIKNGDLHLLVFDPGRACPAKIRKAAALSPQPKLQSSIGNRTLGQLKPMAPLTLDDVPNILAPFRVSLSTLSRNKQYQILAIDDGPPLTKTEKISRKRIKSTTIT